MYQFMCVIFEIKRKTHEVAANLEKKKIVAFRSCINQPDPYRVCPWTFEFNNDRFLFFVFTVNYETL